MKVQAKKTNKQRLKEQEERYSQVQREIRLAMIRDFNMACSGNNIYNWRQDGRYILT